MNRDDLLIRLMQDIETLKAEQKRLASLRPLFTILNQKMPADNITADQTAYDPGDYDMVYMNPTAARFIRGISGGVIGRLLWIRNFSTFNLTFTHLDAAASLENKIVTISAANVVVATRGWAILQWGNPGQVSGAGRWSLIYPAA